MPAALLLLALANGAQALPPAPAVIPTGTIVSVSTAVQPVIATVRVERANVFDPTAPGENSWPFRIADWVHVTSHDEVIRRELLLGPGDRWDSLKALESERNLRDLNLFRRADVKAVPRPDGKVDVVARTQDTWTLNIESGVGTEGGQRQVSYGVSDDNLLGYGKSVSARHNENGDIVSNQFAYGDHRFLGTRYSFDPFFTRTGYGTSIGGDVIKPFFALDTPLASGVKYSHTVDESIIYQQSQEFSKFLIKNDAAQMGYGGRLPWDRGAVQRVEAGWYVQKDQFYPIPATLPFTLPNGRTMSGPVAGYSLVQPRYVKETYINKMERVEDFNMGNEFQFLGGFMGEELGSDRDRLIYNVLDQQGIYFAPGRFALMQVGAKGRVLASEPDNALLFANINFFYANDWQVPMTLVSHLEVNKGRNLDGENQVILGGNNGLRGYESYSFTGDESVLLNLEDRVFMPGEYFHLVRFGGAFFWDSGCVSSATSPMTFGNFKSDLGFGLRLAPTRGQSGNVVRLDLARSLQTGPGPDRWVVSLTANQAFSIFNSSTGHVRETPASQLVVQGQN